MSGLSFEIVGTLPGPWGAELPHFVDRAVIHAWGGIGLERLVVAADLPAALHQWMTPERWSQWVASYEAGRETKTGAISFVAQDAARTAVVPATKDRATFLLLFGHEFLEAALEYKQEREGHVWPGNTHLGVAHLLGTEYVVERARREIADSIGWPYSELENAFVFEQVVEFAVSLADLAAWAVANDPAAEPAFQGWYELARIWSMSMGRADVGSAADREQLERFRLHPLVVESASGWEAMASALRGVYEAPDRTAGGQDEFVLEQGWSPLYGQYKALWVAQYQAAGGDVP